MIDTRKSAILARHSNPSGMVTQLLRALQVWSHRRRARGQLARLDTHLLNDIGLTDAQARREAVKHFWIE